MSGQQVVYGLHFSGADAANIQVGFIPDMVEMWKTGTIPAYNVWFRMKVSAFTSGGTRELLPGDTIQGATAINVRARVRYIQLTSGTWVAGTAAGNLYWRDDEQNGTFGAENVNLIGSEGTVTGGGGTTFANIATVAAQAEVFNFVLAGNATPASSSFTSVTPASGIQPYKGTSAEFEQGFTVTDTLATAGEAWVWRATRGIWTL